MRNTGKVYFPPISKQEWWDKITEELKGKPPEGLTWKTPESFTMEPFYTREDLDPQSLQYHPGTPPYRRGFYTRESQDWKTIIPLYLSNTTDLNALLMQEVAVGGNLFFLQTQTQLSSLEETTLQVLKASHRVYLAPEISTLFDSHQLLEHKHIVPAIQSYNLYSNHLREGYAWDLRWVYEEGGSRSLQLAVLMSTFVDIYEELDLYRKPTHLEGITRFTIHITTSPVLYLEIAKFRALRELWSILTSHLQITSPPFLEIVAHTAQRDLSGYDIHNNIIRNTLSSLAAVMGGCDSLCVLPHGIIDNDSDPFSTKIARNISHILREEAKLSKVVDPIGGSYYLEELTSQLIQKTWELFLEIEAHGGVKDTWQSGWLPQRISEQKEKSQQAYRQGKSYKIGITHYPPPEIDIPESVIQNLF